MKEEVLSDSNNTSKGASIYTNPSILGESNSTKKSSLSILRMSHLDPHVSMKKEKVTTSNYEQKKSLR